MLGLKGLAVVAIDRAGLTNVTFLPSLPTALLRILVRPMAWAASECICERPLDAWNESICVLLGAVDSFD